MKKRISFAISLLLLLPTGMHAAVIDTLLVHSKSMKTDIKVVTIYPNKTNSKEQCPVIYLLHGHGGNETKWLELKPELPQIAEREGIIFVCPDGKNSWYWDSPRNKNYRFETFVAKELVEYIDTHYATKADKKNRAITGFSMGGHGALWLSIRHKDIFGATGSMSGGLDIRPFPNSWNMKEQLGEKAENEQVWNEHTVINQLNKIIDGDLAIIIDCGCEDFFLDANRTVHNILLKNKISHDFIIRPGGHNGQYWNNAIDYQILFFCKFFKQS